MKDLAASRAFYEALGFTAFHGDAAAQPVGAFTDVRDIQRQLKAAGIAFEQEADEGTTGPASFIVVDPDGNQILVDQHV